MTDSEVKRPTPPKPPASFVAFMGKYGWVAVVLVMIAQHFGWITPDQAEEFKKQIPEIAKQDEAAPVPAPVPVPTPAPSPAPVPDVKPAPGPLTPEQIAELIRKIVEESLKKAEPQPIAADDVKPAPQPVPPPAPPVQPIAIRLCDENGEEVASGEVEDGQLFRVSAVGCGDSIGWHPVKSGDVRLSTSTDGKEFCGYLQPGQWVEFSLTDFASKTQASLRVTCNTAPQPPPDDDEKKPDPKPEPKAKNVRLFVIHNVNKITPDAAIVLNATATWDAFTAAGNDWKFFDIATKDEDEKQIIADVGNMTLPTIAIYDKDTGTLIDSEPLPKSVIALEALVERFTEGK